MSDLKDFVITKKGVLQRYKGNGGDVVIPDGVTAIGERAFEDCSSLTNITIQRGVKSIGSDAFRGCSSLTNITIPDSVTSIGDWAFYNCRSLTSITIPDGVTSICNYAFEGCTSLTSITIPDGVISICNSAFGYCSSLTSITIPNGATSICNSAFSGCSSLTSITIPDSVTSIDSSAFRDCSSLTSIIIPDSVTSIGSSAFSGCSNLTSITIPNGVTAICKYAFYNCTSLTSIIIPDNVTSIGAYAFSGCINLTSIIIPESVKSISDSAFYDCTSLTNITIPESLTKNKTIAKLKEYAKLIEKYKLSYGRLSDLDKWNNVIVVEKLNLKLVDNELHSLIYNKYVSGKDVTKLFRLSAVKKHGKFCKLIHKGYEGTTIYKQIPQGEWQIYGVEESQNKVAFKGCFWEVEFNNGKNAAYSSIGLSVEFPGKGFVWLPLRLRLNKVDIPTEKNLGGGEEGLSFTNCYHESFRDRLHLVCFNVGDRIYSLGIEGCIDYSGAGSSQITDYRIGQDENGYYIDVIIEMETADYSYLY